MKKDMSRKWKTFVYNVQTNCLYSFEEIVELLDWYVEQRIKIGEEIEKMYGKDTLSVPVMPNRNFRVMVCYIEDKKSDKK